jgi:hypothetical protein
VTGDSSVCCLVPDGGSRAGWASILLPVRLLAFDFEEEEGEEGAGDGAWREGHSWSNSFQGAFTERCSFLVLIDAPACKGSAIAGTTAVHCTWEPPSWMTDRRGWGGRELGALSRGLTCGDDVGCAEGGGRGAGTSLLSAAAAGATLLAFCAM